MKRTALYFLLILLIFGCSDDADPELPSYWIAEDERITRTFWAEEGDIIFYLLESGIVKSANPSTGEVELIASIGADAASYGAWCNKNGTAIYYISQTCAPGSITSFFGLGCLSQLDTETKEQHSIVGEITLYPIVEFDDAHVAFVKGFMEGSMGTFLTSLETSETNLLSGAIPQTFSADGRYLAMYGSFERQIFSTETGELAYLKADNLDFYAQQFTGKSGLYVKSPTANFLSIEVQELLTGKL